MSRSHPQAIPKGELGTSARGRARGGGCDRPWTWHGWSHDFLTGGARLTKMGEGVLDKRFQARRGWGRRLKVGGLRRRGGRIRNLGGFPPQPGQQVGKEAGRRGSVFQLCLSSTLFQEHGLNFFGVLEAFSD